MGDLAPPAAQLFTRNLAPPGVTVDPVGGQAASLTAFGALPQGVVTPAFIFSPLRSSVALQFSTPTPDVTAFVTSFVVPAWSGIQEVSCVITSSAAGKHYDVGIYSSTFNRIWSIGSTALPGAPTQFDIAKSISSGSPNVLTLSPGLYYFAIACDDVGVSVGGVAGGRNFPLGLAYTVGLGSGYPPLPSSIPSGSLSQAAYGVDFSLKVNP